MGQRKAHRPRFAGVAFGAAALLLASLALTAPSAQAAKQLYNYFGTPSGFGAVGGEFNSPGGVAVNQTGAGPAEAGEIYVVDHGLFGAPVNRIERFERDRHGTADPADDTYRFVSAWGAGVETGGDEYEVCSVAANCHAATASGGNGTASGNGDLSDPYGIAVDQDSGEVYVADAGNNRVNVYAGDGAFLRSFGYDVVQSGPGRIAGPEAEQRLLVKADGGHFSLAFYGRATAARGAGRRQLKDKTIQNVTTTEGTFKVGEGISGECIPPGATIAAVGAGELTMSAKATCSDTEQSLLFGDNFAPAPAAAEVESALSALPTVGAVGGSVTVVRSELSATEFEYAIRFGGSLQGEDAPALEPTHEGLTLSGGTGSATVTKTIQSGALEVCRAAAGDVCKAGSAGTQTGEIGSEGSAYVVGAKGIALSPPDGNPATGRVFLADAGNQRIDSYDTEGESPSSFGAGQFTKGAYPPDDTPEAIAVDSRGIVYASDDNPHSIEPTIKRYDSEDANGEGVGFLAPIPTAVNELQQITVSASEGEFRLCFEGQCTEDMPFDVGAGVNSGELRAELEALPSTSTVFLSGGPGDAGGAHPYQVAFAGTLVGEDVEQLTCEDGAAPLGGGAGCSVTTLEQGKPGLQGRVKGLALRPDPDGAGPESDVLYTADYGDHGFGSGKGVVKQFGPLDPPGLTEPPGGFDELHGATSQLSQSIGGIAVDEASGDIYATDTEAASKEAHGVYVLGEASQPPAASCQSLDEATATTLALHCTVEPNGAPPTSYRVEYSTDGSHWSSTGPVEVGSQESPQPVSAVLDPPPAGLQPNTLYHVRLSATKGTLEPVTSNELTAFTLAEAPSAETVGSPIRTASTAQLNGRVDPRGSATSYRFEYGDEGPCDANPCTPTEARGAGTGQGIELATQEVEGLNPATTYHYRVVAESAVPGSPVYGSDMTVTTRDSDAPLSHGHLPGPPGSDRAYEQVNMSDTGGNPLLSALGFSADGDRALYRIAGGTPLGNAGSFLGLYFAQRTEAGWQTEQIGPSRESLVGASWDPPVATTDLSTVFAANLDLNSGAATLWRMSPGASPDPLFQPTLPNVYGGGGNGPDYGLAADGSTVVALLSGGELDPAYPAAASALNLYALGAAAPKLLSMLPGDGVAACGVVGGPTDTSPYDLFRDPASHWISADGSRVYFESAGNACKSEPQLYLREVGAGATKPLSAPVLSGPTCGARLLKATSEAVFLWTQSRLAAADTATECSAKTSGAKGGDVYRYDLGEETLECLTCFTGLVANVDGGEAAVSDDGSRLYFATESQLLAGANEEGESGLYALDVGSGRPTYVGPLEDGGLEALNPDGSTLLLRTAAAGLNALGGQQNGGTAQYYLYDDRDRSLTCVSCPQDGGEPASSVPALPVGNNSSFRLAELGQTPLSADGRTVAFATPDPLLGADQNSPPDSAEAARGTDVYEWRDGRLLLVTDGLAEWPSTEPVSIARLEGVSPSGRDIYFSAFAQLTPDALDSYRRLYDARIGGGFEFPTPPPPCPLDACQGNTKGAPEEAAPGSSSFVGPGNQGQAAPKKHGKHKRHRKHRRGKHHGKHRRGKHHHGRHGRANRNRGGHR